MSIFGVAVVKLIDFIKFINHREIFSHEYILCMLKDKLHSKGPMPKSNLFIYLLTYLFIIVLGIEPRVLCMVVKYFNTELPP